MKRLSRIHVLKKQTAKTGKYEWAISLPTGNNLLVPKGKKKDDTNIFLKM